MHDTVHGSLELRRRATDVTLLAAGALLMISGHAYRATHIGPLHVRRIWMSSFRRARRELSWSGSLLVYTVLAIVGG